MHRCQTQNPSLTNPLSFSYDDFAPVCESLPQRREVNWGARLAGSDAPNYGRLALSAPHCKLVTVWGFFLKALLAWPLSLTLSPPSLSTPFNINAYFPPFPDTVKSARSSRATLDLCPVQLLLDPWGKGSLRYLYDTENPSEILCLPIQPFSLAGLAILKARRTPFEQRQPLGTDSPGLFLTLNIPGSTITGWAAAHPFILKTRGQFMLPLVLWLPFLKGGTLTP